MNLKTLVVAALVGLSMVGCSKQRKAAKDFESFLSSQTGHSYKIAKLYTLVDGSVVLKDKTTGEYVAYNVGKYNKDTMTTLNDYLSVANSPGDVVHNLSSYDQTYEQSTWHEGYWASESVDVYDDYGNVIGYTYQDYWVPGYYTTDYYTTTYYTGDGFTFSEDASKSKDLDAIAAASEDADNQALADQIHSQFGLSEERSETLANLAVNYSKLEDSRKLTDADKEVFAKEGLGVSYAQLQNAYQNSAKGGDSKEYDSLVSQAAKLNGTTPEKARALMDLYFSANAN